MKVKTNIKDGLDSRKAAGDGNHNQTLARDAKKNLRVKTRIKAGLKIKLDDKQHNQTLARDAKKNLRVKTNVKAGVKIHFNINNNQTLTRDAKKNLRVKTKVKAGKKLEPIKGE
jgi:hypothetical protein